MRHRIVRSYALAATERKRCWSRSTTLRFAEKLVWFERRLSAATHCLLMNRWDSKASV